MERKASFVAAIIQLIAAFGIIIGGILLLAGINDVSLSALSQTATFNAQLKLFSGSSVALSSLLLLALGHALGLLVAVTEQTKRLVDIQTQQLTFVRAFADRANIKVDELAEKNGEAVETPEVTEGNGKKGRYRNFFYEIAEDGYVDGEAPDGRFRFNSWSEYVSYIDLKLKRSTR